MNDVKQVIVIRKDLGMRRGKEIAQGSHASIAWLTSRLELDPPHGEKIYLTGEFTEPEYQWIQGNFRKICCYVTSEQELRDLCAKADAAGIVNELIEDSGLTEFHGVATFTAAAFGPDLDENLDPITGHLVLY